MSKQKKHIKKLFLLAIIFFFGVQSSLALGMSSTHYQINADVIDSGGNISGSEHFSAFDSIGEPFIGLGSSETHRVGEGFQRMITSYMSLTLDSNTTDLGIVTAGSPKTATTVATVTTDAWGGYDLLISQNHNLRHTDSTTTIASFGCLIGAPCVWTGGATGFGFTVESGTSVEAKWYVNPTYYYAAVPDSATIFHTKTGYKSGGDNTTVRYKLDVPSTQKAGAYSNVVTYVAIAKI